MVSDTLPPTAASVDAQEVAKFSRLAEEWWNPNGRLAPLHRLNPVRLAFVRAQGIAHFRLAQRDISPFDGLSLLDIGCGGGLLTEPMARLGFAVTGADPSETNLQAAELHSEQQGLSIDYRCRTAEALAEEGCAFDVVLSMEVLEHVADLGSFLEACAALVKPGGLMIVATINKTLKSLALAKIGAEYVLSWIPRGTHDWGRFVTPARLRAALMRHGLRIGEIRGVTFDPLAWDWRLSGDVNVNYMVVAAKPRTK
jgi:2-polyprenyl-6-hydroxyphenyl methylase/3-demethylubiquinone-9 3-methyltransferase